MKTRRPPQKHLIVLTVFPENVPKRLIREYRQIVKAHKKEGGYQRKLSKKLNVNIKYLNDLLLKGIEPTPRTEKGQIARRKLFLSNKKSPEERERVRKARQERQERIQAEILNHFQEVMEAIK